MGCIPNYAETAQSSITHIIVFTLQKFVTNNRKKIGENYI